MYEFLNLYKQQPHSLSSNRSILPPSQRHSLWRLFTSLNTDKFYSIKTPRWISIAVAVSKTKHQRMPMIKGIFHPKTKILSLFTHPHVIPNLFCFVISEKIASLSLYGKELYFSFSKKNNSTTGLEWYDGEKIMTTFIFGWTIPLRLNPLTCILPLNESFQKCLCLLGL